MDYERYDRFFLILEGQNEEFAMRSNAAAKGHIKIEIGNRKGAMRIGVQNLKYQDKGDYTYKLIFFGTARERTIYAVIGTVNVNKMGSGETYFRFDPADMDQNGHGLSDFSYAIVAAASSKDEKESLHPVLKGVLELPRYDRKQTAAHAAGLSQQGKKENKTEKETQQENAAQSSDLHRAGVETDTGVYDLPICYNSYYNRYVAAQCRRMDEEKNVYDRVVPFQEDLTGAEWTKVTSGLELPIVSPGAQRMAEKYKHYIFGKTDRYYYLGVPGRFLREEQPENGESGFTLWQPILGAEEYNATAETTPLEVRQMAYGYWIIAIDRKNGDIVEA